MIIPLTIESSTSEQLNDFFDSYLTFTQTSFNKNKNLIEESEGIFKRLEDNSIIIETVSYTHLTLPTILLV